MRPTLILRWTLVLAALAAAPIAARAAGRKTPQPPDFLGLEEPHAKIVFVGTFHFADAGLDAYRPRFAYDPLTPEHQREIEDLVARLGDRFRPTKIAIEYPLEKQARLDSIYDAERKGLRKPSPNEITQIGFRLAKRLGLSRVYGVDAEAHESYPGL
ncbi:MAG TPA: DUF5694 domain-containing protein, partial [Dongiaceae bacterium]|nr:DUF5694 domain-containing protein [Dongiaceae bacterium]